MTRKLPISICLALLLSPTAALAQPTGDSTHWILEPGRIIGGSSNESGARLMDPVIVDFDGDGISDIVFGAPGTSPNGVNSAGSVYVIRGKKDLVLNGKIDVTSWSSFDYRFDGHTPSGLLGMNIMTGDFNGDGLKDIAVAEPGGNGTVYVLNSGQKREKGIYDIASSSGANVAFTTPDPGSNLGLSGCVGDFNRDGMDDLALSYISHSSILGTNTSQVVLLAMRREWDKKSYDVSSKIYGKTTISRPVSLNSRVLHSCATGDFNDDNLTDIALGMPMDAYQGQKVSGSVTVIYHPFRYSGTNIDITKVDEKYGIRINGDQAGAMFGYSVAAGDFTGDGRDDLAISAPNRLVKGPKNEGAVYIIDANEWPKETTVQPDNIKLTGTGGQYGFRLQTADVNSDNRPDLVISAPYAGQTNDGAISVYYGGMHFVDSLNQSTQPDIELKGSDFMGFGLGAAFGDINGDKKTDAVIRTAADPMQRANTGAFAVINDFVSLPQSSTITENFLTITAPSKGGGISTQSRTVDYQGKSYRAWFSPKGMGNRSIICLVEKNRPLDADISMSSPSACDIQIVGPENYEIADFAFSKSATGKPTLTIGVPNMPLKKATGFVAVIPLPESITQPLVLNLNENTLKTEAMTFVLSDEQASALGYKLEWRDLDKDGFDDLIIGAPKRLVDQEVSGTVFVVKGDAKRTSGMHELTGKGIIQYEGFADEELGTQWIVTDFNQDHKLDLLIRAGRSLNATDEEYASIYVVYDAGLRDPKAYNVKSPALGGMRIVAPQARSGLEIIPQTIDINNDGFDDLILISPEYRAGLQKLGIVYAIASSTGNKSGELFLNEESHHIFSFTPGRNQKLTDARFIRVNSKLDFVTVTTDIQTGLNNAINLFTKKDDDGYHGDNTESQLTRVLSEAKTKTPAKLMLDIDPNKKQDELWLIFPFDGVIQSGQGIAQKVRLPR